MRQLGKLTEVEIRQVWSHEQYDFSAWLAEEANLQELGNALGISLTDAETEKDVGEYRCDIFCKEETTGRAVLIENQLEATNHDHLGKIITYASGLDAALVIWIVTQAREEHASAIEWLNKHTDAEVDFFLVELHAYKIGDSEPAPLFKIVEQLNNFAKTMKAISQRTDLTATEAKRLEFWNAFNGVVERMSPPPFNRRKASTDSWYTVAIGTSQCHISIDLVNKDGKVRVNVWIPDNKALFRSLAQHRAEIEGNFGEALDWQELNNKKASRISYHIPGLDFNDTRNYPQLMDTIIATVVRLRESVQPYIQ